MNKKKIMIIIMVLGLFSFVYYYFLYLEEETDVKKLIEEEIDQYNDTSTFDIKINQLKENSTEYIYCDSDIKNKIKNNYLELYNELHSLEQDLIKFGFTNDSCYIWDLVHQKKFNGSDPNTATAFMHIRKTGGTSFSAFLTLLYDCECPSAFNGYWKFSNKCNCDKNLHCMFDHMVTGDRYHLSLEALKELFKKNYPSLKPEYVTIIREPLDMFNSVYKQCSDGSCWSYFQDKRKRTIQQFIDSYGDIFYNQQIKFFLLSHTIEKFQTNNTNYLLTKAKKILLEDITFFGINQYFYNSTELFIKSSSFDHKNNSNIHVNKKHGTFLTPKITSFLEKKTGS
eukprot:TRINITY_DN4149_c0_g1_i1.p1 TRINITY_DN4149_c0_g1~~TRINITY_DN4149_c0_g1_i1.p1  ORF type:complete len:340 (-),score=40.07 TRINITY_DN4149_c0_g1_i1:307-1326(-)